MNSVQQAMVGGLAIASGFTFFMWSVWWFADFVTGSDRKWYKVVPFCITIWAIFSAVYYFLPTSAPA